MVEEQIVNCNVVSLGYRQLFRSFYHKLGLYTEKKSKYSSKKIRKRMKNGSCDLYRKRYSVLKAYIVC